MAGSRRVFVVLVAVLVAAVLAMLVLLAPRDRRTYTSGADFRSGLLGGVDVTPGGLAPSETPSTFPFLWVARSAAGTVVKIDTSSGAILGEYLTAPEGRERDPSPIAVDLEGNAWVGNRGEAEGGKGSVVQIGLAEAGGCVDRNGSGVIDTSTGRADVRPWPNDGGADDGGGVSTAADECVLRYVRVEGDHLRHVTVDADDDVWTGGNLGTDNAFDLVDGRTGAILRSFDVGCGGHGGVVDADGVLWSGNRTPGPEALLRYRTDVPIDAKDAYGCSTAPGAYDVALDPAGFVWQTQLDRGTVLKWHPSGGLLVGFPKPSGGAGGPRGVAVTPADGHVWVANGAGADVSRLDTAGELVAVIEVGTTPTGVAVDAAGKVWVTGLGTDDVRRIDPATNTVDLTVDLGAGAGPDGYGDMTGLVARGLTAPRATWTAVFDTREEGSVWGTVSWTAEEPAGSAVRARARSADTPAGFGGAEWVTAENGADLDVPDGRYLQVELSLARAPSGEGPVVSEVTIARAAPPPG